jgi:hypothetical protein
MAGNYQVLFRLRITHSFYTSGYANDFSLVPLPQTQKLSKQYKLLFREVENGMDVLSLMKGGNTPFLNLGDSNKLSFALMLKNVNLLHYSNLPTRNSSSQIYQLENIPEAGTSITTNEWNLVEPRPVSFNYTKQANANKIRIRITGPFGTTVVGSLTKTGNQFAMPMDLANRPEGKYTVQTRIDGQNQPPEHFYISEMLWQKRPFAIMDVYSGELRYDQPITYSISMASKKSLWTYKVNLGKDYTGSTITIEDSRETPEVVFKQVGNQNQTAGKVLTFTSYKAAEPNRPSEIAFSEAALNDFKLVISKNGTTTEITGLPNPSINQPKTEMHINI